MGTAQLVRLAEADILKKYQSGENIVNEGDFSSEMYIILSGKVEIFKTFEKKQYRVEELGEGDVFGEQALLDSFPQNVTAKAVTDTTVITFTKTKFEKVICQNLSLVYMFIKKLSSRIQKRDEEVYMLINANKVEEKKTLETSDVLEQKSKIKTPEKSLTPKKNIDIPEKLDYKINSSETDNSEKFLYDKKVTCPICQNIFHTKAIRNSRLTLARTDLDLRQHFQNFEPLWYKIWVCPHCYYANFSSQFTKVKIKEKEQIAQQCSKLQESTTFSFSSPRQLTEVIKAYYLAVNCTQDVLSLGRLWLCLSWLHKDMKDEEMFKKATKEALKNYKEAYFNLTQDNLMDKDQQLSYLLAELFLRDGQAEEAKKFYFKSIVHKGGNSLITRHAQIRVDELRKNK